MTSVVCCAGFHLWWYPAHRWYPAAENSSCGNFKVFSICEVWESPAV